MMVSDYYQMAAFNRRTKYTPEFQSVMEEAAATLLASPVVTEFFREKELELFDAFCSLPTDADPLQYRDIINRQNLLAELLQYMQSLSQNQQSRIYREQLRPMSVNLEGVYNERGQYNDQAGQSQEQIQVEAGTDPDAEYRDRILGINGVSGADPDR